MHTYLDIPSVKPYDLVQAIILNTQAVIILSAFFLALTVMLLFLLLKNHKRNHRLLESVKREALNGYMMTDKTGRIIAATKAFLADTGYDHDAFKTSGQYAVSDCFTTLKPFEETVESLSAKHKTTLKLSQKPAGSTGFRFLTDVYAKRNIFGALKQILYVRKPFVPDSCDKDSPLESSKTMLDSDDIIHTVGRLTETEASFYLVFIRITNKVYIRSTYPRFTYDKALEAYYERLMSIEDESMIIDQYDEETLIIISKKASRQKFTFLSLLDDAAKGLKVGARIVSLENKYGMTEYPRDGRRPQRLMQNAESAMNTVVGSHYKYKVFTEEFSKRNIRKFNIQSNLHEAITQKQFHIVFQPQISLQDNRITGFEALLRWDSPILGTVTPNEFIPIAEQYGYIDPLTNQVIDDVLHVIPFLEGDLDSFRIAINISPVLFEDRGWLQRFVKRIKDKNIANERLEIEVTESFLIGNSKHSIQAIEYLHRKGFTIAIDDFGSGFSSLQYLKTLPIDKLKIDKSFIYSLSHNDRNICKSIIDLGHNIGATVLGEGVESEDKLSFLRNTGCDHAQGYLFARPMPFKQLMEHIRNQY